MTLYDEFRYPGKFYPQASPERMATLATLFGARPTPVDRCRVLELGCGEGGHTIPLAYVLPQSQFVGVDLSEASIKRARELVARLDLKNAEFRALDLRQFPADAGTFDYIIAHGLYSWVPEAVRQAVLEVCGKHLAPDGVVYVSYNTYPAGHLRQIPRDLMRFHTRHISDPATKVREARNILEFVISAIPQPTHERELLKKELAVYKKSDAFVFFDPLSETSDPFYFLDFMEQAAAHGLQFVAEAEIQNMRTAHLAENVRRQLDAMTDRLLREQYLDFINWRGFRQTILCRAGHDLDLNVAPERMERLMIMCSLKPVQPIADRSSPEKVEFRDFYAHTVTVEEPLPKAVYVELGERFPRAVRYAELRERACRRVGLDGDHLDVETEAKLIRMLVSSYANGVAEFHAYQGPFCTEVSERPVASALARFQAEAGTPVTSLYLAGFTMEDSVLRRLLPLLDGTRDHAQLLSDLRQRVNGDQEVSAETMGKALKTLASYGMLMG
jgi:SAM-dependent methyltransferase/methyltransferase-like protein